MLQQIQRLFLLSATLLLAPACGGDIALGGGGETSTTAQGSESEASESGGASSESGDGDGDGDSATGDGDGDGDGDSATGDGDGDPTTGDGDGDGDQCSPGELGCECWQDQCMSSEEHPQVGCYFGTCLEIACPWHSSLRAMVQNGGSADASFGGVANLNVKMSGNSQAHVLFDFSLEDYGGDPSMVFSATLQLFHWENGPSQFSDGPLLLSHSGPWSQPITWNQAQQVPILPTSAEVPFLGAVGDLEADVTELVREMIGSGNHHARLWPQVPGSFWFQNMGETPKLQVCSFVPLNP